MRGRFRFWRRDDDPFSTFAGQHVLGPSPRPLPPLLHRDVGAAWLLHDRRGAVALRNGHRARRPRLVEGRRQRDLRHLSRVRLLHALPRRHPRGPVPRLPQVGAHRRACLREWLLPARDWPVVDVPDRARVALHRQRLLQAQHQRDGGQPLCEGRSQARCGVQHLLHGDQHRRVHRELPRGLHAQRMGVGSCVRRRWLRHARVGRDPARELEDARSIGSHARLQPRRHAVLGDPRQDPWSRVLVWLPRLGGRGLPAAVCDHEARQADRLRLLDRRDSDPAVLRALVEPRRRGREARSPRAAARLPRRRHVLHGAALERQRDDDVGRREHGAPFGPVRSGGRDRGHVVAVRRRHVSEVLRQRRCRRAAARALDAAADRDGPAVEDVWQAPHG